LLYIVVRRSSVVPVRPRSINPAAKLTQKPRDNPIARQKLPAVWPHFRRFRAAFVHFVAIGSKAAVGLPKVRSTANDAGFSERLNERGIEMTTLDTKGFAVVVGASFIAAIGAFGGSIASLSAEPELEVRRAEPIVVTAKAEPLEIRRGETVIITAKRTAPAVAASNLNAGGRAAMLSFPGREGL
jgi:hypothetical protein